MSESPCIYTLTGNLLAERTIEFDSWTIGRTQRARREIFHTRGKGVNVSNMLSRLATKNIALIFSGGASGAECEAWFKARGLAYQVFTTEQPSRTGTVIWSDNQAETTFLGPNVTPDDAAVQACADYLDTQPDGQVLALCGSFPGWEENHFEPLRSAIIRWVKRGRFFADVYGPPLLEMCQHSIDLIKINQQEFDLLFPEIERSQPVEARLRLMRDKFAVKSWVISNGPDSIWVMAKDNEPIDFVPPKIEEVSPTGSGDVLFASMLHALVIRNDSLVDAVKFGLPYAAANAAHPGVADFDLP